MLRQALILTSLREYAQSTRTGLLELGDGETRIDVELDALRAMQLVPQQYDLILLDAMLDSMDGLQLLLLMKQQAPSTKFIIVSDVPDERSRAQAYQNGADFFLERPRSAEDLRKALDAIRGLLRRLGESQLLPDDSPVLRIADMVQTHCLSGDSVLLLVRSKGQSGDIFIFRGEVYHAQYPGKGGQDAFLDMMHWDNGLLQVKSRKLPNTPPRTIEVPYRQLLAMAEQTGALDTTMAPGLGELMAIAASEPSAENLSSVVREAPPLTATSALPSEPASVSVSEPTATETPLPALNSHWKINLMGELVEGSQMAEPDRCAFITYFIYRKMADVAVALELDYFREMTLFGPHLQQVLVADNLGVHQAVFDTAWTVEDQRVQFMKWCREQSL